MVNDKNSLLNVLKQELPFLKSEYGVERIGLFGSFVRDTVTPESDVDLIIEFNKPIGFGFFHLADYLENKLERKVDILSPLGVKHMRIKEISSQIMNELQYVDA